MITSDLLAEQLRSMVVMKISDRIICEQSAIRLLMLEQEIQSLIKQLQEAQNERV
jgi:hypothetical protein